MTTREIVILVKLGLFDNLVRPWEKRTRRNLRKELRSRELSMNVVGAVDVVTALIVTGFWTIDCLARLWQWHHSVMIAGLETTALTLSTAVLVPLLGIWYMNGCG